MLPQILSEIPKNKGKSSQKFHKNFKTLEIFSLRKFCCEIIYADHGDLGLRCHYVIENIMNKYYYVIDMT